MAHASEQTTSGLVPFFVLFLTFVLLNLPLLLDWLGVLAR